MWAKWIVRILAAVYIVVVGEAATLIAPEIKGRFARWFRTHPLLVRLDGIALIAIGTVLALREYREEEPPPWWRRIFGR